MSPGPGRAAPGGPEAPDPAEAPGRVLAAEESRWLHDKYERLAATESALAGTRTSYFAAIGTVLITALVVALYYFLPRPDTLVAVLTFVAGTGVLISGVWAVLLHRTNDAQSLWREAAYDLEMVSPPVPGRLDGAVSLRSGEQFRGDLLRPYALHRARFDAQRRISWQDRVSPDFLTELLPRSFLVLWTAVLLGGWAWYLFR